MEFKYEKKFENNENWYTVGLVKGIVSNADLYAVEIMDPAGKELCEKDEWKPGVVAIALFGITEDEYNMFSSDREAFDELVKTLKRDIPRDRLFAEKNCVRKTDRKPTIDADNEFKKFVEEKMKGQASANQETPAKIMSRLLSAEKIHVAYSNVTGRPVLNIANDKVNLILTEKEEVMDKYISKQQGLFKKTFLNPAINTKGYDSVYVYFYKIGINMLGYLVSDNMVGAFPMEALIKSDEYVANPPAGNANPLLDRYITSLFQFARTTKVTDENKEMFNKNMRILDIKVMEQAMDAKFILSQLATKTEDGKVEFKLSVVEQNETGEKYIPVATCDEEYIAGGEGYQKVILGFDKLKEVITASKLDGFVVNCKSKSAFKFNKQKIEEIDKFREWRAEQMAKQAEKSEENQE